MRSGEKNNPITIVYLRERAGKTQQQIAIELKKAMRTIYSWDAKEKSPVFTSATEIEDVLRAYECTFPEFLEAFSHAHLKLSIPEVGRLLDRTGLTLEDLKRLSGE
jgi:transcriptional regulator with XRE-family HTH domain